MSNEPTDKLADPYGDRPEMVSAASLREALNLINTVTTERDAALADNAALRDAIMQEIEALKRLSTLTNIGRLRNALSGARRRTDDERPPPPPPPIEFVREGSTEVRLGSTGE